MKKPRDPQQLGLERLSTKSAQLRVALWEAELRELSILRILDHKRDPQTDVEQAIFVFWTGAEILHGRSLQRELIDLEVKLNGRNTGLRVLFPWTAMWWHVEVLRELKEERQAGRGRRPMWELHRELAALKLLVESGNVTDRLRPALLNEFARLERLRDQLKERRPADSRTREVHWEIGRGAAQGNGRVKVRSLDPERFPPNWMDYIRRAGALLQQSGFSQAKAIGILDQLLVAFFAFMPCFQTSDPQGSRRARLRAALNYRSASPK